MSVAAWETQVPNLCDVVETRAGEPSLKARRMALGLTVKALAERAGVDRSRVAAAESGSSVRSSTLGLIEKALTDLESEVSGPYDDADQVTNVIELPDGTRVTFIGSAENVVNAAQRFLNRSR